MNKFIKYLIINTLYDIEDEQVVKAVNSIEVQKYHDKLYDDNSVYEWFDCIPEIAQAYENIPLSSEQLSKVEKISGESCQPHHAIMPNWDGEGDEFNPDSLSGIEQLPNLKEISFIDFTKVKDFSPLFMIQLELIEESVGMDEDTKERLSNLGVTHA